MSYVWIALGGAIGSMARYWCSGVAARHFGETFPWGTLLVNASGSFAIGLFATITDPDGRLLASPSFRQFIMIGIFGGFTTFSSFSLQTLKLAQEREWLYAGLNIIGSVALCLVSVWLGHVAGELFNKRT